MQVGQVVKATAGRDKGSFFAVTYAAGAEVYIADGKTRRLGKPKRKNARHIEAITQSINYISKAISCCDTETVDIVILEIKKAWESLGKITGETENESIIDAIFSKFCLGK